MKFSLSWLKDHLETDASIEEIAATMTMIGLEVEGIDNPGEKLGAFSVARIVEVAQHPNADKLQVCQVETKDGRKEIVCGALNARAGLVTIYAPLGTYIPGSGITLEAKPVRGVVSNGMLCSESELDLDGDLCGLREGRFNAWAGRAEKLGKDKAAALADGGIAELPDDAQIGAAVAGVIGMEDPVIDFEVTPNRPDWLGVNGIARDLAAAGLGKFITKGVAPAPAKFNAYIRIATDDEKACPLFAARMMRGVKNGPSPDWLQQRLKAIGIKPRNLLVDVTNYLSFDRARPLHVYDADKLKGTVRARLGRAGESFVALDGKSYDVTPAMCVIADDARVLGLGGVMGGEDSGCSDKTVNVLIESALFDPLRIFQAGRATGINSDARYRFERGVDPEFTVAGLEMATRIILEHGGGEASDVITAGRALERRDNVLFDPDRVHTLAGIAVTPTRVRAILKALGFETSPESSNSKRLIVRPPSWRRDVEGQADLVEEVARIEGFDKLPAHDPPRAAGYRAPPAGTGESRLRVARRALAGAGYLECVTWSFCAKEHAAAFGLSANAAAAVTLANPIAADLEVMRPTPLPNLIRAAQRNADRGLFDARLFEAGPAYRGDDEKDQARVVSAIWRPNPKRHWRGAAPADLFDIKRDMLIALEAMGAPVASLQTGPADRAWLHPGRSGALKLGPKAIAVFGEAHPRTLQALDVGGPVLVFEIDVDAIPSAKAKPSRARPPLERRDLNPLTRDFAFIVDEKVSSADLVRAAYGADKTLITDVTLFDVYRGQGVPDGAKSLAIEVTLQPIDKTLTEPEIESVAARIVAAAMKATGAKLRG